MPRGLFIIKWSPTSKERRRSRLVLFVPSDIQVSEVEMLQGGLLLVLRVISLFFAYRLTENLINIP